MRHNETSRYFDLKDDLTKSNEEEVMEIVEHYRRSDLLQSEDYKEMFNKYPDLYIYRGGDGEEDLNRDYTFLLDRAIAWSQRNFNQKRRRHPVIIKIKVGDLDKAIKEYAYKELHDNISVAYSDLIGSGQSSPFIKIDLNQLNRFDCLPIRSFATPLSPSLLLRMVNMLKK